MKKLIDKYLTAIYIGIAFIFSASLYLFVYKDFQNVNQHTLLLTCIFIFILFTSIIILTNIFDKKSNKVYLNALEESVSQMDSILNYLRLQDDDFFIDICKKGKNSVANVHKQIMERFYSNNPRANLMVYDALTIAYLHEVTRRLEERKFLNKVSEKS